MNTSINLRNVQLVLVSGLIATLLLFSSRGAAQSITMPRMHAMPLVHAQHGKGQMVLGMLPAAGTPNFTFAAIDVPGASGTLATGINGRGDIVGIYYDSTGNSHGFLLERGTFYTVDVPGNLVGVSGILQTEANGINNAGDIVGDYFAPPGAPGAPACTADTPPFSPQCRRGFLYHRGKFSDVLVPGKKGSIPNAISPDGTVYGCDHDDNYLASMVGFGRIGLDTYITLNAGGGELSNPDEQVLASMNNGATPDGSIIVGLYVDPPNSNGRPRGYIVQNGHFRPYDISGSKATQIWGINATGDFVGLYDDSNGNEHGFLQNADSSEPISIDVPSGPPFNATLTDAFAINVKQVIVGVYVDTMGNLHGYAAYSRR